MSWIFQRKFLVVSSLGLLILFLWYLFIDSSSSTIQHLWLRQEQQSKECRIKFGPYRGPQYYSPESGSLGKPKCLLESKWIKVSQHTVQFPGSETTMNDWMWIDYHDRINVLVQAPINNNEDNNKEIRFLIFEQTKYALEGRSSKAIIGGIMEPGETAEEAAKREVKEEMNGLICTSFHFLGRYRTDVNRGMGWVNSFLATECQYPHIEDDNTKKGSSIPEDQSNVVGVADTERQDLKSITLTELKEYVTNGEFIEVQWTATVGLALLHPKLSSSSSSS